jgi:hypothetical protein
MEKIFNITGIVISLFLIYKGIKEYVKIKKDRANINSKINENDFSETGDLKISSMTSVNFLVNFGEEFDYCKFYFLNNEVYILFRYSYPKDQFSEPFAIYNMNQTSSSKYSYFISFFVKKFKIDHNTADVRIVVSNKFLFIGSRYSLNLTNVSSDDLKLLLLLNNT